MTGQQVPAVLPRDRWLRRLYLPAYPVGEVACLADIHRTTVSRWYFGGRSQPGMRRGRVLGERERGAALSYLELVEVAFVATLRRMGVPLRRIRIARSYLAKVFDEDYPFARVKLKTDGARVLCDLRAHEGAWIDRLLVEASADGQIIWADPIRDRIREFDWDDLRNLAIRWFPRGKDVPIVVDPQIQFGTPIIQDTGIPTFVIKERYQAGETMIEMKEDFGIEAVAIRHALEFERIQPMTAAV